MYSKRVIAANLALYERASKHRLVELTLDQCQSYSERLDRLLAEAKGDPTEARKKMRSEDHAFIRNERVMSRLDFVYWAARYGTIQNNSGGICKFVRPWDSQRLVLDHLSRLEEERQDAAVHGDTPEGLLLVIHKARQVGECLVRGTPVLTADLRWVPIETLEVGDAVVGVDERNPIGTRARKMRTAVVLGKREMYAPTYHIVLEDGTDLYATGNHPLLYRPRRGKAWGWVKVGDMRVGDEVRLLARPWPSTSIEDAWFGGLLDGEGSHRAKRASGPELTMSQIDGPVLQRAIRYLQDCGYKFRNEEDKRLPGVSSKLGRHSVYRLVLHSSGELLRLLGQCRPTRFLHSGFWEGRELPNGVWSRIVAIEKAVDQVVVNIETTTGTYIANGVVSHNTALARLLLTHRLTTQEHRRAMGASIDESKVQELYDRDKLIVDNLPWWLKPSVGYDEKRTHIYFDRLDSRTLYQVASQKTGLGVGRQFNYGHLTELSTWELVGNPDKLIELDFIPTLPSALSTLCIFESVAFGRGNWWHKFSERVRHKKSVRFRYSFIPWYAEPDKYALTPPDGWQPNPASLLHAQRCHDTSLEFLGRSVMLTRAQLYWWEVNREEHRKSNNLIYFLINWPATPEESFQFTQKSVWPVELIEDLRAHATIGRPYELLASSAPVGLA